MGVIAFVGNPAKYFIICICSIIIVQEPLKHFCLQVGAINFSSTYADFQNPLKVLNLTHNFFNVVIPNDALARDDLMDLPEVSLKYIHHY